MKKIFSNILLYSSLIVATGCGADYLETSPTDSISEDDMFATVQGARTALEGIHRSTYKSYNSHDRFGQKAIDITLDMMGEDMLQIDRGYGWFVNSYRYLEANDVNSLNLEFVWSYYYDLIDNANILIERIDDATDALSFPSTVKNYKAQAYAYRAYSHYQLVQMFANRYDPQGDNTHLGVPVIIDNTREKKPRATVAEVYNQIIKDIDESIKLFNESTDETRVHKSHISLQVAQGIKARIALTTGDWETAVAMANAARQGYSLTSNYMNGWNDLTDREWIWGAQIIEEHQTSYASYFSHMDPFFGGYAYLGSWKIGSTEIFDYMADTDQRKLLFQAEVVYGESVAATYCGYPEKKRVGFKFNGNGEWANDYLYMKAGEMYLIEAEALARLGRDGEAQSVIFELTSNRDPEAVRPTATGEALIEHILMERRCDLWGEGFRLLDVKRLNIELSRWDKGHEPTFYRLGRFPAGSKYFTFLIPQQEMDSNPNMVQNPTPGDDDVYPERTN